MSSQRITDLKEALVGKAGKDALESRIFLTVNLICMTVLAVTCIFNYLIGIPELALLMFGVFVITAVLYYLARFRRVLMLSIVLYSITFNLLLVLNFFYNSGINGPTLLIFVLSFFVTIAIVPPRQYWLWTITNIVLVFGLLAIGYRYPSLVPDTYPESLSRYADFSYTYLVIAVLVLLVTNRIRGSYIQEKMLAEQKAMELEQSNATKNKLFSILAHDLRSPLSSIQNFLEILNEYKLEENERLTLQKALLTETQHTQQMLTNILSWSKEQMDGVTVRMEPLNVVETLAATLHLQQTAAKEKCIGFKNEMDPGCCAVADPDMLQLVIRNLLNNAIKFTPEGGEVSIGSSADKGKCLIWVKDTGRGIPADQQKELFSLKAKSTFGTNKEKGVGLGLVLCREFTELQNGQISFESRPGAGTTFFITLQSCITHPSAGAKPLLTEGKLA